MILFFLALLLGVGAGAENNVRRPSPHVYGVWIRESATPKGNLLMQLSYQDRPWRDEITFASIISVPDEKHNRYQHHTVATVGLQTLRDVFPPEYLLSKEFQEDFVLTELWSEDQIWLDFLGATVDDTAETLLFVYTGIKELYQEIERIDASIAEAESVYRGLDPDNQFDRQAQRILEDQLSLAYGMRTFALRSGVAVCTRLLAFDILLWAPRVLRGLLSVTRRLFKRITTLKGVSAAIRLPGRAAKPYRQLRQSLTRVGLRLGIQGLASRTAFIAKFLRSQAQRISVTSALAKAPRLQQLWTKYFAISSLTPTQRRLFFVNLSYGMTGLLWGESRERQDRFIAELDEVALDTILSIFFTRIALRFDTHAPAINQSLRRRFGSPEMARQFSEWYRRQGLYQAQAYSDAAVQLGKRYFDDNELSGDDLEFLYKRLYANMTYNMTRGPLAAGEDSRNRRIMNHEIWKQNRSGSLSAEYHIAEGLSRMTYSFFGNEAYFHHREELSRSDIDETERLTLEQELQGIDALVLSIKQGRNWIPQDQKYDLSRMDEGLE